jgi:hypothetical protein
MTEGGDCHARFRRPRNGRFLLCSQREITMPIFGGRGNDGQRAFIKKKLCGFPRGNHSDKNKVVPLFLASPISF